MDKPKFLFGDIVVFNYNTQNENNIGIVVKTWEENLANCTNYKYDVYNRITSQVEQYYEFQIDRYRVRHKYLNEEELYYQNI